MNYVIFRNYFLSIILAIFFFITLIVIIYLGYKKLQRLDQAGLTPEDIYRQPRIIFLGSDSQNEYFTQAHEEKKGPIMPKEVEPYVFYCSDCDITSLGYDVFCPVCSKRMKRPELATAKDPESITCIICHSKKCPVCEKDISGDEACYEECPYCERSYHKHCWEKTMQVFGKCGQCLERPPSQLVDGDIKSEEIAVESNPQTQYEPMYQQEYTSFRQEEYAHQEENVPLFQEDAYTDNQWEYESYRRISTKKLRPNLSERILILKITLKKNILILKKYVNKAKFKVKIFLEERWRAKIVNQEQPQLSEKTEGHAKDDDDIIDIELLNQEIYLEGLHKIDVEEIKRKSLSQLPKIDINEVNKEIALEKQYETETGKHAIWRGKRTKGYLKWKEELSSSNNKE